VVEAGVDGIGLGGAQILRFMDKETGFLGPFKPENISGILEINQRAAHSMIGQGGKLLARLDRMYYELSISESQNKIRESLYLAMNCRDEKIVEKIVLANQRILEISADNQHPVKAWAERVLNFPNNLFKHMNSFNPENIIELLKVADFEYLKEVLDKASNQYQADVAKKNNNVK
jgi:hypothetical protein